MTWWVTPLTSVLSHQHWQNLTDSWWFPKSEHRFGSSAAWLCSLDSSTSPFQFFPSSPLNGGKWIPGSIPILSPSYQALCSSRPSVSFPLRLGTFLLFKVFCKFSFLPFLLLLFFFILFYKLICFQFHLVDASVFSYLWLSDRGIRLGAASQECFTGYSLVWKGTLQAASSQTLACHYRRPKALL